MDGLLPIGSVVLLEGAQMLTMIVGLNQVRAEEVEAPTKVFDYVGVPYPLGFTAPDEMYRFDREAIDVVYNVGYINDNMLAFMSDMQQIADRLRDGSLTIQQLRERNAAAVAADQAAEK